MLDFTLPEGLCLHLVLIVDGHNLLEVSLLPGKISHQVTILGKKLPVLSFEVI